MNMNVTVTVNVNVTTDRSNVYPTSQCAALVFVFKRTAGRGKKKMDETSTGGNYR